MAHTVAVDASGDAYAWGLNAQVGRPLSAGILATASAAQPTSFGVKIESFVCS
jgi:hypothetical protein